MIFYNKKEISLVEKLKLNIGKLIKVNSFLYAYDNGELKQKNDLLVLIDVRNRLVSSMLIEPCTIALLWLGESLWNSCEKADCCDVLVLYESSQHWMRVTHCDCCKDKFEILDVV